MAPDGIHASRPRLQYLAARLALLARGAGLVRLGALLGEPARVGGRGAVRAAVIGGRPLHGATGVESAKMGACHLLVTDTKYSSESVQPQRPSCGAPRLRTECISAAVVAVYVASTI